MFYYVVDVKTVVVIFVVDIVVIVVVVAVQTNVQMKIVWHFGLKDKFLFDESLYNNQ